MKHTNRISYAALAAAAMLSAAAPAMAAEAEFHVPAGDLATALDIYAQQSGEQLIYSVDSLRGVKSPGATGLFEPASALQQILRGTHFAVRREPTGSVIVDRNAARVTSIAY